MKNQISFLFILTIALLTSSCQQRYTDTFYATSPFDNLSIAILPYEVYTTGRIIERLSEEQLREIEAFEQYAFQSSMYHQFLERLGHDSYATNVQVQHYSETNRLIKGAGYQTSDLYNLSVAELATLLDVDAIIRSNVHKQIFLTDNEAFGLDIARDIIFFFGNPFPWWFIPGKSGEIRVSSSIISTDNGTTLWAGSRKCNPDWDRDTYDTIERINYQLTKRMPL